MRFSLLFWLLILVTPSSFAQVVASSLYSGHWASAGNQAGSGERTVLEGSSRDFSYLGIQTVTLLPHQPTQSVQQFDREAMLVIQAGESTLTLGGKREALGPGSVAIIMPGDDYQIENKTTQPLTYYLMQYTSNEVPDLDLYRLLGGSFWIDWSEMPDAGGQKESPPHMQNTIMSNRVSIRLVKHDAGRWSQPPHSHRAAEILIMLDASVEADMNGKLKMAQPGDLIFIESDVLHSLRHTGVAPSMYLSIQF